MKTLLHGVKLSTAIAVAVVSLASASTYAGFACCFTPWLITPEEMAADAKAPERPVAKSLTLTGAPKIQLLAPSVTQAVAAPFPIELKFQPGPDARVNPETFKVLWGRLGIDITKRVLEQTRVTEAGLQLSNAKVPPGTHRLRLSIEDDKQREGMLNVTLEVKE